MSWGSALGCAWLEHLSGVSSVPLVSASHFPPWTSQLCPYLTREQKHTTHRVSWGVGWHTITLVSFCWPTEISWPAQVRMRRCCNYLAKSVDMKRGSKQGCECNYYLSMSGTGGQRLRSHLDLQGLPGQAGALQGQEATELAGWKWPEASSGMHWGPGRRAVPGKSQAGDKDERGKRPPSWLAKSGLKQAGTEPVPNHLLLVPRKGLRQMPRPIKDPSRADLSHKSRAILDVICFYLKLCFLSLIHLHSNFIIFAICACHLY